MYFSTESWGHLKPFEPSGLTSSVVGSVDLIREKDQGFNWRCLRTMRRVGCTAESRVVLFSDTSHWCALGVHKYRLSRLVPTDQTIQRLQTDGSV